MLVAKTVYQRHLKEESAKISVLMDGKSVYSGLLTLTNLLLLGYGIVLAHLVKFSVVNLPTLAGSSL